jgi:hypothetical protein
MGLGDLMGHLGRGWDKIQGFESGQGGLGTICGMEIIVNTGEPQG